MEVFLKYYEKKSNRIPRGTGLSDPPGTFKRCRTAFRRLMGWIDEVAGLVGIRHSQCNVITASVDNLKFIRGVFQNDLVVLVGTLTWVGSTSMEVRVDTYVEKLNGTRYPVNRAYLTLVAVDETGKPTKVPGLLIESIGQQAEWEAGQKRKELRIQRNKEGF